MSQDIDTERLDDVVLALLWANSFDEHGIHRAWKSLPWDVLDRLHERGLISDPRSRAHSVVLVEGTHEHGRELFERLFQVDSAPATAASPAKRSPRARTSASGICQFKVALDGIKPPIWRRIQLPDDATFWDLHCAINDAMGWEDMHLHAFHVGNKRDGVDIGIPMDEEMPWDSPPIQAGWDVPIAAHFDKPRTHCHYLYDFGDNWSHRVTLEKVLPREPGVKYPRCTDGARACPPEDCGGAWRYAHLCELLAKPRKKRDEEDEELLEWIDDDFDPEYFDAQEVEFYSAKTRLKALRQAL